MIETIISNDKCKIEKLETMFPNYFENNSVNRRYENNKFTEIFTISDKNQKIIGFIILDTIYDRMELIQIEVSKEYQNKGYANKLLKFMLEKANAKKVENITLEVCEDNFVAIHLYEKYGFKKVAIRKNYYHNKDGILMERKMM